MIRLLVVSLLSVSASAWVTSPLLASSTGSSMRLYAAELKPEPEGGTELTPLASMPNCRMKELQQLEKIKTESGDPAHQFWMTATVDGALIKEIRTQILKDASKKANFPGFRKGQVPPYAQPQITQFSLQESIIKTVEAAVEAFGLKSLPGSDGEIEVHEDVKEMCKGFKVGDSVDFTCTLNAAYDPEKKQADIVVDAEVVEEASAE